MKFEAFFNGVIKGLGMPYTVHGHRCPHHHAPAASTFGREHDLEEDLDAEVLSNFDVHLSHIREFGTTYHCNNRNLYLL